MTDTIVGYINKIDTKILEEYINSQSHLGFKFTDEFLIYNLPKYFDNTEVSSFYISDSKQCDTAETLLNELDYDPLYRGETAEQKLIPASLKNRIKEILLILDKLILHPNTNMMAVCISRCDEIEEVKFCERSNYKEIILSDCLEYCPPNTLYIIT